MKMNKSDLYKKIYSGAELYRPPQEKNSLLIELGQGCSWGKCDFCDFSNDMFHIEPLDKLRERLYYLSMLAQGHNRLHLGGCNPLTFPSDYLMSAFTLAKHYLPGINQYSMYARAEDVLRKNEAELKIFRDAGLNTLHIGLESGSNQVLKFHCKGETVEEIQSACLKLDKLGIAYHLTIIPGLGGKKLSHEHLTKTAEVLSRLHPQCVWALALTIWNSTPLWGKVLQGEFEPMGYYEIALEERKMIEQLSLSSECLYVDSTLLKRYTVMSLLPKNKDGLLAQFDKVISNYVGPEDDFTENILIKVNNTLSFHG